MEIVYKREEPDKLYMVIQAGQYFIPAVSTDRGVYRGLAEIALSEAVLQTCGGGLDGLLAVSQR